MADERITINSGPIRIGDEQGVAPERTRYPAEVVLLSGNPMFHNELGHKDSKRFVIDLDSVIAADVITANYNHNADEQVGVAENIRVDNGRLVCDAWIVPFRPKDRAEEIIFRSKNKTPYEASIEFPPLEPIVEPVEAGESVTVNGIEQPGPINVYRSVPIRAWAVCPVGNDSGTKFTVLKQNLESFETMTKKQNTAADLAKLNEAESQGAEENTSASAHPDLDELLELFGQEVGLKMYKDGVELDDARKVAEFNDKYGIVPVPAEDAGNLNEDSATPEPAKEDDPKSETAALRAQIVGLKQDNGKLFAQLNKLTAALTKTGEEEGVSGGRVTEKEQKPLSEKDQYLQGFASKFAK